MSWSKKRSSGLSPGAREVSACRHTIKKLQNRHADVQRELEESRKENRILNRLRIRHERDLNRYQSQEGELPQLLTRHSEEVCWKSHFYSFGTYVNPVTATFHCINRGYAWGVGSLLPANR